ncbi:MAG: glycosyltransferase family 39 protein, partial [Bacteroidales bacterium]
MKNFLKEKEFLVTIALFTLLRLVAVLFMGLMPQDAYYTYYADSLALSYFDHPPMVAYMIKFFLLFLGKSALSLHIADFIVTSFTLLFLYLFLKQILGNLQIKRGIILIVTAPVITVLSINTTPDVPLLFFWSLSLLLGYKAIKSGEWYWWVLAGLGSGLAFTSKYTGIFFPAGMFLFLLISKENRKYLLSYKFILFALSVLVAVSPVIIWNIQNEFISLKYQSADRAAGLSAFKFNPALFPGFVGSQLLLALPAFLIATYISGFLIVKKFFKREKIEEHILFAASFALPMLLSFTALSFVYWVKINWIMPVFLSATVLAATYLKNDKLIRWQTLFSIVVHIGLLVQLIWAPVKIKSDDTWLGWEELAHKVDSLEKLNPNDFFFSDNSYKIAAVLNFYSAQH